MCLAEPYHHAWIATEEEPTKLRATGPDLDAYLDDRLEGDV